MSAKKVELEHRLAGEQQTLALSLRALLRHAPVVCREQHSVREAVAIMHAHGVGSVVVRLQPWRRSTQTNTTCAARMAKTTMRVRDLAALSGNVPWGTSGFGVFIFISFDATQRPFLRSVDSCFSPRGFPSKNPEANSSANSLGRWCSINNLAILPCI